jgi:hypothetical protein
MRMHAHCDQRAVTADWSERNQDQIAPGFQVELNLAARHLVHPAAWETRVSRILRHGLYGPGRSSSGKNAASQEASEEETSSDRLHR